jgi:DNA-directed RNA polymerase subunit M/transcription elongation factor TFIIS
MGGDMSSKMAMTRRRSAGAPARGPSRATFSSLKAVWLSRRISNDILYRGRVDRQSKTCPECGAALHLDVTGQAWDLRCEHCRTLMELPEPVRAEVIEAEVAQRNQEQARRQWSEEQVLEFNARRATVQRSWKQKLLAWIWVMAATGWLFFSAWRGSK